MKPIENEADERQRRSNPEEPVEGLHEATAFRAASAGVATSRPNEKNTWGMMQQPSVDVQGNAY